MASRSLLPLRRYRRVGLHVEVLGDVRDHAPCLANAERGRFPGANPDPVFSEGKLVLNFRLRIAELLVLLDERHLVLAQDEAGDDRCAEPILQRSVASVAHAS